MKRECTSTCIERFTAIYLHTPDINSKTNDNSKSTTYPQPIHNPSTFHPQPIHNLSTIHPQSIHNLSTIHPHSIHNPSTFHPHSIHNVHSSSTHCPHQSTWYPHIIPIRSNGCIPHEHISNINDISNKTESIVHNMHNVVAHYFNQICQCLCLYQKCIYTSNTIDCGNTVGTYMC